MSNIKLTDELFANVMDKVVRERAIKKIMNGRKRLLFSKPGQVAELIEKELGNQYEKMMKTTDVNSKMSKYYQGVEVLISLWNKRLELYLEPPEILNKSNPKRFKTFDEYICSFIKEDGLETMILKCADIYDCVFWC
ncbi:MULTISPECIES: hypothetical protein [unclassified Enterococcus]|uniref:hypothetical protein n=1 Tax=unclassified Enterococcus TaxID=2608891 RepID=UPI001556A940|nr:MULTISPECIES: hypothetical protein [unclassified Enterococcus]MBS7577620.1 hypothetical protein [Enterococcus sp. MMGLQ5-2]MBS7584186.1 hypothetical protein [Enterococcus sp. MMGLQ5-1]NPD12044.1 hypothetical protein [Enterococcus sp. MMGLQ5-1]NPD37453.1 hypothetical protein [Enterococcus sp. MMGLQ5-2]